MTRLFASAALLPDGLARDVAIDIADGRIAAVEQGASPTEADERHAVLAGKRVPAGNIEQKPVELHRLGRGAGGAELRRVGGANGGRNDGGHKAAHKDSACFHRAPTWACRSKTQAKHG